MYSILIGVVFVLTFGVGSAVADMNCPKPPNQERLSSEVEGKMDARLGGIAKNLIGGDASLDAKIRNEYSGILSEFPNADQVYVKDRAIYVACEIIRTSPMSNEEKILSFERMIGKMIDLSASKVKNSINNKSNQGQMALTENEAVSVCNDAGWITYKGPRSSLRGKYDFIVENDVWISVPGKSRASEEGFTITFLRILNDQAMVSVKCSR